MSTKACDEMSSHPLDVFLCVTDVTGVNQSIYSVGHILFVTFC